MFTLFLLGLTALNVGGLVSARPNRLDDQLATLTKRTPPKSKTVLAQLFQWNWDSVASACETSLGPFGYGYVQVSPAHEHVQGTQWWTDYQPVSYKIASKRGTRAQFASMVSRCNAVGVGVIVDAVLNLAGAGSSGTGVAGSTYSAYNFPAVPFTQADFHAPCAVDWNNATSVYDCQLSSLSDLRTENTNVQTKQAAWLNDLISLGVAGFRLDAARSMRPSDIAAWEKKLSKIVYIVQETTFGGGANEASPPQDYIANGDVNEFYFSNSLYDAFAGSAGLSSMLKYVPGNGWVGSSNAVVFVDNHDTERESGHLTSKSANNAYVLAHVYMLAQPYGTPEVYSGYDFTTFDQGAPLDSSNNVKATTCYSNGWRCEHQWTAIANMVAFRNAVGTAAVTNLVTTTANRISFGRGTKGHLVMNNEATSWTVTLKTSVPNGSYCDIIHDTNTSPSTCAGSFVTVSGGSFTVTVPPYDAVAFYSP